MIKLEEIESPKIENNLAPVLLTDETINLRKNNLIEKMKNKGYDALVIYADLEHGSNFEYLTGFVPRFEEALLILYQNGKAYLVLGNENLNKAKHSRIEVTAIHMPHFSLPNQPMNTDKSVLEILRETGIEKARKIGLVGWKNFTSKNEDNKHLYDIPYFLVNAFEKLCKDSIFYNATDLLIGASGVRTTNNANEIAHYEFGAAIAGNCILQAMNHLELGVSEMDIASQLEVYGQPHSVVTIMSTGERFVNANLYPMAKTIKLGDRIAMTTGYKGGLQSRNGYAVHSSQELPVSEQEYLDKVALPYFNAIKTWLEHISIGMTGKELYDEIEKVLPKKEYGWALNPGHLCADEEWMSSPIYEDSTEHLVSGMLLQIDIIPSVAGFSGASCESGIVLADSSLRATIQKEYPEMWKRIQVRRQYMIEKLGIQISEEILPTSNATAYFRPFLLNKKLTFISA